MTTPEQERNLELVRGGLERYVRGQVRIESFHPDVVIHVPPEMGNAGTYRGHEGFRAWTAAWNEAWESERVEVLQLEALDARTTLAQANVHCVGRGSGVETEMDVTYVHEVEPETGLCTFLGVYHDRSAAVAAAGELGRGR